MRLTDKQRDSMSSSTFALQGTRKFPMPDKNHARVALSYASRMRRRGQISPGDYHKVVTKAHGILGGGGAGLRSR